MNNIYVGDWRLEPEEFEDDDEHEEEDYEPDDDRPYDADWDLHNRLGEQYE